MSLKEVLKKAETILYHRAIKSPISVDHYYQTAAGFLKKITNSADVLVYTKRAGEDVMVNTEKWVKKKNPYLHSDGSDDGIVLQVKDDEVYTSILLKGPRSSKFDHLKKLLDIFRVYEKRRRELKKSSEAVAKLIGKEKLDVIDGANIEKQIDFQFMELDPETYEKYEDKGYSTMTTRIQRVKKIGEGGMCKVYLALEQSLNGLQRYVAIKELFPKEELNEKVKETFLKEMKTVISLTHPNIIELYDTGTDWIYDPIEGPQGQKLFLLMEYIDGLTLEDLVENLSKKNDRLPSNVIVPIIRDVAAALEYAHSKKVIHRDIKPGNIMIPYESGVTKVVDFGLAGLVDRMEENDISGTCSYMSPEQARGEKLGYKTDIFSLGALWYYLESNGMDVYDFFPRPESWEEFIYAAGIIKQADLNRVIQRLHCEQPIKDLIQGCCSTDARDRYDATELIMRIDHLPHKNIVASYLKSKDLEEHDHQTIRKIMMDVSGDDETVQMD